MQVHRTRQCQCLRSNGIHGGPSHCAHASMHGLRTAAAQQNAATCLAGHTKLDSACRAQGAWETQSDVEQHCMQMKCIAECACKARTAHAPIQTEKRRSSELAGDVTLTLAVCGASSASSRSSLSRRPVSSAVPPAHGSQTRQLSQASRSPLALSWLSRHFWQLLPAPRQTVQGLQCHLLH